MFSQILDSTAGDAAYNIVRTAPAIANYLTGSQTITITCATPGDLSVNITFQTFRWTRIGNRLFWSLVFVATPTFTTASGALRIQGFPFAIADPSSVSVANILGITVPSGEFITGVVGQISSVPTLSLQRNNGAAAAGIAISNLTSGTQFSVRASGHYEI